MAGEKASKAFDQVLSVPKEDKAWVVKWIKDEVRCGSEIALNKAGPSRAGRLGKLAVPFGTLPAPKACIAEGQGSRRPCKVVKPR
jgi:hypothetical protein